MNPARLLLLVFLLVALAAGALWLGRDGAAPAPVPAGDAKAPAAPELGLLGARAGDLRGVTIHLPDPPTVVRVRREEPRLWHLDEPWDDRADLAVVDRMLLSLRYSAPQPLRDDWAGRSAAELGLDPPVAAIELEVAEGGRHELLLGAADPGHQRRVARFDGRLLMLDDGDVAAFYRPQIQWRDTQLFAAPGEVEAVRWRSAAGVEFAIARSGQRWRLTEPASSLLAPNAESLVARMLRARTGPLPDECVSEEDRELMRQGDRIVLRRGGRDIEVFRYRGLVLASDRPYLLASLAEDFQLLALPLEQMRSPYLFDLLPGEVVSAELAWDGGAPLRFVRRASGWYRHGGELLAAPAQLLLGELVEKVAALRPAEAAEPLPATPPTGRLILSRSMAPRAGGGGVVLDWWARPEGMPLAAPAGAATAIPLDFNLDLGARGLADS